MSNNDIRQSAIGIRHFFRLCSPSQFWPGLSCPACIGAFHPRSATSSTFGADRSAWRAPPISEREKDSPWDYYPNT